MQKDILKMYQPYILVPQGTENLQTKILRSEKGSIISLRQLFLMLKAKKQQVDSQALKLQGCVISL